MNKKIQIDTKNAFNYFYFQAFSSASICIGFDCGITEYNDYLLNDALRSADDHIAYTWLLTERETEKVTAYMSLIMDSIKLSFTEKE